MKSLGSYVLRHMVTHYFYRFSMTAICKTGGSSRITKTNAGPFSLKLKEVQHCIFQEIYGKNDDNVIDVSL